MVNLNNREWIPLPERQVSRFAQSCGYIISNGEVIIIVAGGSNDREHLSSSEMLNLNDVLDGWNSGPDLPRPLESGRTVQFYDHFLITGGYDGVGDLSSIYRIGPTLAWQIEVQSLQYPRNSHVVFAIPDKWTFCT